MIEGWIGTLCADTTRFGGAANRATQKLSGGSAAGLWPPKAERNGNAFIAHCIVCNRAAPLKLPVPCHHVQGTGRWRIMHPIMENASQEIP